jgi:uncharacterized protein YbjQ (UPF0145 family)
MDDVLIVTSDQVPGYNIVDVKGLVIAVSSQTRWIGADFLTRLRDIFGGRVKHHEELMKTNIEEIYNKLKQLALEKGANAIISMRLVSPEIGGANVSEIIGYGTAVVIERIV